MCDRHKMQGKHFNEFQYVADEKTSLIKMDRSIFISNVDCPKDPVQQMLMWKEAALTCHVDNKREENGVRNSEEEGRSIAFSLKFMLTTLNCGTWTYKL